MLEETDGDAAASARGAPVNKNPTTPEELKSTSARAPRSKQKATRTRSKSAGTKASKDSKANSKKTLGKKPVSSESSANTAVQVASAADKTVPTPKPRLIQRYREEVSTVLRREFGYVNRLQVPKPVKVVLNISLGEAVANANAVEAAVGDLATITGQRPVVTRSRMSIANFKLREGMRVGVMVTLRGDRMWQFLDRLMNSALPRVRDFHGVPRNSFDGRGNYTLGIAEQVIFPEIDYNQIDRLRGLQVTVVTTARTDEEARRLLDLLGMPFVRSDQPVAAV